MTNWHRLLGLLLADLFTDSPYDVELESDLSVKRQMLDVVIIRRKPGEFVGSLPVGLEDLADHNLITYKSHEDTLDAFAIDELVGHFANYCKQISPSTSRLLPMEMFNLYAISARTPRKLQSEVKLEPQGQGLYHCIWGTHRVRIVVLREVPDETRNAIWGMFSNIGEKVALGARNYHYHISDISTVIDDLLEHYELEGLKVPYTIEDYRRDYVRQHLKELPPEDVASHLSTEQRLSGLPPEQRLQGLSPEELASHLSPEQRLQGLSPEELASHLSPEQRLHGLPTEVIEAYLRSQTQNKRRTRED